MGNLIETRQHIIGDKHKDLISQLQDQIKKNKWQIDDTKWGYYGEPIESYDYDFKGILKGVKIIDLLKSKPSPIVIDLMGPSDTLASLFEKIPGKPELGIAHSYCDRRDRDKLKRDNRLKIKQVSGDILELETWKKIEKSLNGRKADLIMERCVAGKKHLTSDVRIHATLLNKMWRLLSNNNGIILAETPNYSGEKGEFILNGKTREISEWLSLLEANGIEADYSPVLWQKIKLVKTQDSPQNLPFLE